MSVLLRMLLSVLVSENGVKFGILLSQGVIFYHVLQNDYVLMCNNAMTYNRPETIYYKEAKRLLQSGLKMMSKVVLILFTFYAPPT